MLLGTYTFDLRQTVLLTHGMGQQSALSHCLEYCPTPHVLDVLTVLIQSGDVDLNGAESCTGVVSPLRQLFESSRYTAAQRKRIAQLMQRHGAIFKPAVSGIWQAMYMRFGLML
jgi:hypothetical protein